MSATVEATFNATPPQQGASSEVPPPLPPRENNPKRIFDQPDIGNSNSTNGTGSSASRGNKPDIAPHRTGSHSNRTAEAVASGTASGSQPAGASSGGISRNSSSRSSSKASGARRTAKMMNKLTATTAGGAPGAEGGGGGGPRTTSERPPLRANGELPSSKIYLFCYGYRNRACI